MAGTCGYITRRTYRRPDGTAIDLWEQRAALVGLPVHFPAIITEDPRGRQPDGFISGVELVTYERQVKLTITLAEGVASVRVGVQIGFGWLGRPPNDTLATVSIAGIKS